ncbi:hypothetical protein AB0M34_33195 [Nocardia sp. NPDC050193]
MAATSDHISSPGRASRQRGTVLELAILDAGSAGLAEVDYMDFILDPVAACRYLREGNLSALSEPGGIWAAG